MITIADKERMWELQCTNDEGEWEAYPDPLRETKEQAEEKMAYCKEYIQKHNMSHREYRVVKLNKQEIEKHNQEWNKWVSMID